MLAIAVVTIGTSAEDSGRPWRNYVDDEDGRCVRDALDGGRPWRNYVDDDEDGRSVRDGGRPWRNYVDDERSVRDAHDDDDGRQGCRGPTGTDGPDRGLHYFLLDRELRSLLLSLSHGH
eukprot:Em0011g342a